MRVEANDRHNRLVLPAVVPFSAAHHLAGTIDVLLEVREADATYPPLQDAQPNAGSLTEWLFDDEALARWVAVIDGVVVGHVQLCEPHRYLAAYLDQLGFRPAAGGIAEIAQLLVSPAHRRRAVGSALLRAACGYAWAANMQPALAVVTTSEEALRLCAAEGLHDIGGFFGVHGEHRVLIQKPVDVPVEVRDGR